MYQEFSNNRLSIAAVDASWDKFVFKIKAYKYTLPPSPPPPACLGHADTYASRGDTCILGGGGGSDLTSSLEAKFGARSRQVHQIRGKVWEVLLPQDAKVGKKSQFWGQI